VDKGLSRAQSMKVTYRCPRCQHSNRQDFQGQGTLQCGACQARIEAPADALVDGKLTRCLACPSTDLFVRKMFPQRVGLAIVTLGFIASSIAWYYAEVYLTFGILFATALVDVVLFAVMGNGLVCYRCGAEYRDCEQVEGHAPFNLETHERYRQQAARLGAGGATAERPA
jgi:hypothetical protein